MNLKSIIIVETKCIFLLFIMILVLTGCSNKINESDNESLKTKVDEEIDYLQNNIICIVNKYVKNEYVLDNEINWDDIEKDVETIENVLDTLILDMTEINVPNEDLVALKNEINGLIIAINHKDEIKLLDSCSYLYSLIPLCTEKYSKDKNQIDILKLKSYVLTSLVQSNSLEWDKAKETINIAESKYSEMSNRIGYMQEYSYNINRIYVLLEELKNAIELKEIELIKIKYIYFIEKVN